MALRKECRLCKERGKTWEGSDPVCAFPDGVFSEVNWNCATMNQLRYIARENDVITRDDNSCGTIGYAPMSNDYADEDFDTLGGYIVMTWYKGRGRTGYAVFMSDEGTHELTLKHAELAIRTYEEWRKCR